ncbi:uncharacterized protein [Trachinotus anak]|uniref:uncharacterized protein isoform X1 n=1 Tax=Trachinotus anak TaxID=443729 RepID=UPI0039F1E494
MPEFRWIHMSLFLILLLHFTAAVTGQLISFLVREGEDVTLPCNDVTDDRDKCGRTSWTLVGSKTSGPVELVTHGKINETAKDRLSVTENCSLVIKKVTAQDVGLYVCQRSKPKPNEMYLSIVNMTEEKDEDGDEDDDEVTLTCSVSAPVACRHTVKWLFEGKDVNKVIKPQTSQPGCSAKVTRNKKSKDPELFKCEVVDNHSGKVQQFIFSPQSSGEDEKEETTKTTTVKPATEATPAVTSSPATATEPNATSSGWWAFIAVPVVLAALVVVLLVRRKRTKGQKTQVDPNTVTFKPTDPEDGVSYASISYNKTNSKPRVKGNNGDDDEDDAVTYTTVKVPSTDPSNLYSTVNTPDT